MITTLKLYAMIVCIYGAAVLALQVALGVPVGGLFIDIITTIPANIVHFVLLTWKGIAFIVVLALIFKVRVNAKRVRFTVGIFLLHTILSILFFMFKTSMPNLSSFWADPWFARADEILHGTAPYNLTHSVLSSVPPDVFQFIYSDLWFLPAFCLPIWVAALDADQARVRRFIALHSFVWIILGSVFALAFLSAGPVYHDRIVNNDAFAGLAAALRTSGLLESPLGDIQALLWTFHVDGESAAGMGISAFPSVHVGMACVIALYLFERLPKGGVFWALIVVIYQVLSVHLGWHYAVDGYASIIGVWGFWAVLRKRAAFGGTGQSPPPQTQT